MQSFFGSGVEEYPATTESSTRKVRALYHRLPAARKGRADGARLLMRVEAVG